MNVCVLEKSPDLIIRPPLRAPQHYMAVHRKRKYLLASFWPVINKRIRKYVLFV